MSLPDAAADAVMMPESLKRGETMRERVRSLLALARPLLGLAPTYTEDGVDAWIHRLPGGRVLVTRGARDTEFGAAHAPPAMRGRPRYTWVDAGGVETAAGIRRGYLKPEFRDLDLPAFDPVAAGLWRPGRR